MRTIEAPLRLQSNRLKFRHLGARGHLIGFHELTDQEKEFLFHELTQDVRVHRLKFSDPMDELDYDRMFLGVLNSWGVSCGHPRKFVEEKKRWYECRVCGCSILPSKGQTVRVAKDKLPVK